ncbi:MAG TPA: hypothetical protein VFD70_10800 [Anaerolineae bacterium]|nr:hypothetical protein [Anaerolineae bacterium]
MSGFTAADYLTPFRDAIPTALIAPENFVAMERIAAQLPGVLTSFFGFECRLGATATASDILFAIDAREMEIVAGRRGGGTLPPEFFQIPAWRRVRDLCSAVSAPHSPLSDKVDNLWLEFDIAQGAGARAEIPVPSVFFGSQCIKSDAPLDWFTDAVLPTLYGEHLSPPVETRVVECVRAMPPNGFVFQVGAMMSRQPPFVRLCLTNFGPRAYPGYLEEIGWRGAWEQLEEWIHDLTDLVDMVLLDIDVSERVGATIGLECYFEPRRAPQFEPRWYPFLDFLQARGLLTDAKRQGLIEYSGFVHEKSPAAPYPPALLDASKLLGRNFYSSILRGPHHIKIVLRPDEIEAKGYFYVQHYWLKPSDLAKPMAELSTPSSKL